MGAKSASICIFLLILLAQNPPRTGAAGGVGRRSRACAEVVGRRETTLHEAVRGGHEATTRALGLVGLSSGVGESLFYMAAVVGS
jgi:hypothetical protein